MRVIETRAACALIVSLYSSLYWSSLTFSSFNKVGCGPPTQKEIYFNFLFFLSIFSLVTKDCTWSQKAKTLIADEVSLLQSESVPLLTCLTWSLTNICPSCWPRVRWSDRTDWWWGGWQMLGPQPGSAWGQPGRLDRSAAAAAPPPSNNAFNWWSIVNYLDRIEPPLLMTANSHWLLNFIK